MDNADKMTSLTHKEVALFLGDDLKNNKDDKNVSYSLADEYEKTKKNHEPFVWILLGICFFLVGIGTFITTKLLSDSNEKITINIDSFNDLNLRSLLNNVGRAQSNYENAVKSKLSLEDSMESELSQAQQKRDNDLFTVQSIRTVSSLSAINARKKSIEDEYQKTVEKIRSTYEPQLLEAEEKVRMHKELLSKYDSPQLSHAQKEQSSIDSNEQLHSMQMKNMEEQYEKKIKALRLQLISQQIEAAEAQRKAVEEVQRIYQAKIDLLDPKAREQSAQQDKIILGAGIQNEANNNSFLWDEVDKLNFSESDYTVQFKNPSSDYVHALKKTHDMFQELKTIALRFKTIPMENSIKDYTPAIIRQSYRIADELASGGQKMQQEIDALSSQVKVRNEFFERIISENGGSGIVVNTDNPAEIIVYMSEQTLPEFSRKNTVDVNILTGAKVVAELSVSKNDDMFIAVRKMTEQLQPAKKSQELYAIRTGDILYIPQPQPQQPK